MAFVCLGTHVCVCVCVCVWSWVCVCAWRLADEVCVNVSVCEFVCVRMCVCLETMASSSLFPSHWLCLTSPQWANVCVCACVCVLPQESFAFKCVFDCVCECVC